MESVSRTSMQCPLAAAAFDQDTLRPAPPARPGGARRCQPAIQRGARAERQEKAPEQQDTQHLIPPVEHEGIAVQERQPEQPGGERRQPGAVPQKQHGGERDREQQHRQLEAVAARQAVESQWGRVGHLGVQEGARKHTLIRVENLEIRRARRKLAQHDAGDGDPECRERAQVDPDQIRERGSRRGRHPFRYSNSWVSRCSAALPVPPAAPRLTAQSKSSASSASAPTGLDGTGPAGGGGGLPSVKGCV